MLLVCLVLLLIYDLENFVQFYEVAPPCAIEMSLSDHYLVSCAENPISVAATPVALSQFLNLKTQHCFQVCKGAWTESYSQASL
jgi:hypothetical protein